MIAKHRTVGTPGDAHRPWLRHAGEEDLGRLRVWRNANACRFHQQADITSQGQKEWYKAYLSRADDHLFLVMEGNRPIGCIGIRLIGDVWDLYNIIRGMESPGSGGFMSVALEMVIEFARGLRPLAVRAEVLLDNPAMNWYLRNGFVVVERREKSLMIVYRRQEPTALEPLT